MKVMKPFMRDGKQYLRGDALPADLDKTELAHYRRHGMAGEGGGKTAASTAPAPAPRTRQVGPAEKKPASPAETKPAGPTNAGAQGVGTDPAVSTAGSAATSETLAVGSAAVAAVGTDPLKGPVVETQAASLPLGA